jgi:hypothetical protein
MLTAIISGDRAAIFANLHDDAITRAANLDMPTPVIDFTQFCNFMRPLIGRRLHHEIILSTDN